MPKRSDISSILIIGAGPIVIGQACEFDYSGVQAVRALREEGYRVILVNSNPATIMTDPEIADVVYIEPIRWQTVKEVIAKERPDALLPTMGGQTALNCALDLEREGVLAEYGVEMIGASKEAIDMAEDREKFRVAMGEIGLSVAKAFVAHSMEEALEVQKEIGYPTIIRPSFTLGGSGGGIAYNEEEFEEIVSHGLDLSPTTEVLLEESVLGWKEFELEVVRDRQDNCIIICSIENIDPMGIHTGDSITVAPAQTLTDREYQALRNAAIAVLRKIGVDTGGSNVQFAVNPEDGRVVVIEMNPRVSRSSALASKATGFPIAKVAAKLAIGYTLDELKNEITGGVIPASFEPTLDYVVTKIPRFAFEKFPAANDRLTTQMKSVGEAMSIGRTFQESLQKALISLETGLSGFDSPEFVGLAEDKLSELKGELTQAGPNRLLFVAEAFRFGLSLDEVHQLTHIDRWFLDQILEIVEIEKMIVGTQPKDWSGEQFLRLKRLGFSDERLATLVGCSQDAVREYRLKAKIFPSYRRVDTCAAEFESKTAYMYSTWGEGCEAKPTDKKKIMVLGGGPNRIGQGIEFDYCCVHAAMAMRDMGFETIMVNCNPETVSTDYDTSDRLYFEPLTLEHVLSILDVEKPDGVIIQFGGQTPLKLARALEAHGAPIVGTTPDCIDLAEDRERFQALLDRLGLKQPPNRTARTNDEALRLAGEIGYPLVVRPSYVLGGRAMDIVHDESELGRYMTEAVKVSNDSPVLLDRFLDHAIEVDVDAICDGDHVIIAGIMEHIEEAGVHSGDSSCSLPVFSLGDEIVHQIATQTRQMALALNVVGLMNVQFAVKGDEIFVLEVNPRASRTVPFVAKATGVPVAKIAARCMVKDKLDNQGIHSDLKSRFYALKEPVYPFIKFQGVDPILGPEMRSTGEVMGVGLTFGAAVARGQKGAGINAASSGRAFLSVRDADKERLIPIAQALLQRGFELVATEGTFRILTEAGIACEYVNKVTQGRPHIVDLIKNREIDYIINTTEGRQAIADSFSIRRTALQRKINYSTTIAGAKATLRALDHWNETEVRSLNELYTIGEVS